MQSLTYKLSGLPGSSVNKEYSCNAGDLGSIPGLERSPGEEKDYLLQYSGLENSMDCICPYEPRLQLRVLNEKAARV